MPLIDKEIRDTQTYSAQKTYRNLEIPLKLFQVSNNLDSTVTVTFEGTHRDDEGFDDSYVCGSRPVPSGSVIAENLTDPWDEVKVSVEANSAPTNGNLVVYDMYA